jgi:hypothetical protein
MGYMSENTLAEMRGSHELGIFLNIGTDPALHVWFGDEDKTANFDSIDPDGTVYLGGGRLINVPSLEVLVNGAADRVEFTISGIDPKTGASMLASLPPVRGVSVKLGLATLDKYWQPMGAIIPVWEGTASHASENSPPVGFNQSPTLSLSLAVVTGEATRSRPARSLWSAPHQKAISPTDKFCDETARLARGVQPPWGLGY